MTVIGIDLGTTNSAMAIYKNGKAEILVNDKDERTTPSVFQITKKQEEVIGLQAKNQAESNPKTTAFEVKRKMGLSERIELGDKSYLPEEISSKILSKLIRSAKEKHGLDVTEAVITVPAFFSDAQRKSTKIAGELAGIKVERIINEPTAAALAFCHDNLDKNQMILVYDFGGGTFDVSVVEVFEGIVEVKASSGDNFLGGADLDEDIINEIKRKFSEEFSYSIEELEADHPEALYYKLKAEAEKTKIGLSSQSEYDINFPFLGFKNQKPVSFQMTLTRNTFEKMISGKVKKTISKIKEVLEEASLSSSQIDEILMVGGSTRIPLVKEEVSGFFGKNVRTDINPDEVVALGAAIQGAIKSGEISSSTGLMAIDVCPYTLGTEVVRHISGQTLTGFFDPIIMKNSAIPITKKQTYTTAQDYQTMVQFPVFQGEGEMVSETELVSEGITVDGIPADLTGNQPIEVQFTYDINGLIHIEATIVSTGKKVRDVIKYQPGVMSENEKEQSMKQMETERLEMEAIISSRNLIQRAEKIKDQANELNKNRIELVVDDLNKAINSKNMQMMQKLENELTDILIDLV
ncbi:Hsp70 family protein [Metaplanococcus flavidus]